jgi:hypothetical protein
MAERVREAWPAARRESGLDRRTLAAIDAHMATVPVLTGRKAVAPGRARTAVNDEVQPEIA